MSKSTPLSQLSNNQPELPVEEEKEALLVNEILNEINKDEEEENVNMDIVMEEPVVEVNTQTNEPPVEETVTPIAPKEPESQNKTESQEEAARRMFKVDESVDETKSFVEELLDKLKPALLVGLIVVLFSIPKVTEILSNLIPPREILQKFKLPVLLLMKFILSAVAFFGINMAL